MAEHKSTTAGGSGQGGSDHSGSANLLQQPLRRVVVTPEATILDRLAEFVTLPLYDGEIGVGRGHSPMIGRLGFGELRLRGDSGQNERYYVGGGFVQIADNVVSVLTENAMPAAKVDAGAAADNLRAAHHQRANSDAALDERERLEAQARAQLRMAHK